MGDFSLDYQDDDEKEKDRVLREFLAGGGDAPKPVSRMSAADFADDAPAAAPQTRLEATGRAAQADGPDELQQALTQRALASLREDDSRAPHERQMASGPDIGVGLGPAAALVLDAFVNHGRGAGQITGATVNSIDQDRRAEQQRLDRLAEIEARRKSSDPMKALVDYRNVSARDYEDRTHQQTADTSGKRLGATIDPNSIAAQGKVELTGANARSRREGFNAANHENAPTAADDAALKAGAVRGAVNDQTHLYAPTKAEDDATAADLKLRTTSPQRVRDAAAIADAQSGARQPYVAENREAVHDEKIADLANPNTPTGLGQVKEDRAAAQQYTDKTKFGLDAFKHVKELDDVMSKYKDGELPGVGFAQGRIPTDAFRADDTLSTFVDPSKPNQRARDAVAIRRIQSAMANAIERPESGAAIGLQEDAKYLMRQGAAPGATEDEFRKGLEAYRGTLVGHLTSNRVGKESAADKVLASQGITPEALGIKSGAADTRAAVGEKDNTPPAALRQDDPAQLPVTGKGRAAAGPKVSDVVSGAKGPGLDENGLSTGDDPTQTYHYRSRKTGAVVAVKATAAEKAARPGLEWLD